MSNLKPEDIKVGMVFETGYGDVIVVDHIFGLNVIYSIHREEAIDYVTGVCMSTIQRFITYEDIFMMTEMSYKHNAKECGKFCCNECYEEYVKEGNKAPHILFGIMEDMANEGEKRDKECTCDIASLMGNGCQCGGN